MLDVASGTFGQGSGFDTQPTRARRSSFRVRSSGHYATLLLMANTFNSRPRPGPLSGLPLRSAMSFGRRESMANTMEGALSVPPDRGTIIGRAVWKVGGQPRTRHRACLEPSH